MVFICLLGIQLIPELNILEHYEADNVTVTVEWAQQQEPGILYSIEVTPDVPTGKSTESIRYRLTIPYNETYNF